MTCRGRPMAAGRLRFLVAGLMLAVGADAQAADESNSERKPEMKERTVVLEPGEKLQPEHLHHRVRHYRRGEGMKDRRLRVHVGVGMKDGGGEVVTYTASIVSIDQKGRAHGKKLHYASPRWNERSHLVPYVHGVKHGTAMEFIGWSGGGGSWKITEIPWVKGKITGVRKSFDKAGNVVSRTTYEEGKPVGESKTFNAKGQLLSKTVFVDGKKHGKKFEYWPESGEPRRIIPYRHGNAHGTMKAFHLNGKLKRRVECRDGLLHGEEVLLSDEGKVMTRRFWLDGEMVSRAEFELAQREPAPENEG